MTDGPRTVIRVTGVLDGADASELRARLAAEARGALVVIDLTRVRAFADPGVATLARGLAGVQRPFHLRGLRQRELRILRYFGVDVQAPARRPG